MTAKTRRWRVVVNKKRTAIALRIAACLAECDSIWERSDVLRIAALLDRNDKLERIIHEHYK